MALDSTDFNMLKSIRNAVVSSAERTNGQLQDIQAKLGQGLQNDREMVQAFNRVATALETLTGEIRALREDLKPPMDKPGKLAAPKSVAGGRPS